MKSLSTIVILFWASFTFGQQPKQNPLPAGQANPLMLVFSNGLSHDFGTIKQNEPASYTFEFTNTGKEPVIITGAKPSCSCTVPEFTKDPVLSGKKGIVKATFNAHTPGKFSKTITVTTDKGETIVLSISGEVIQ